MAMTVSVGVIGTGVMGADHARTLATQVAGVRLRAVSDADQARARVVADETGAETVAKGPLDLINDPSVDAVLIASPDATHCELTLACLAAKKPVLCEKPLAPTPAECLTVVATETKLGRRLVMVGYMRRFDPAYLEMKAALDSGKLGRALFFHCIHRNLSAPPWFDAMMAISNSAVHEIDISRWLLGEEHDTIQVLQPQTSDPAATVAPVFVIIRTTGGKLVSIENNNNGGYGYDVKGELACEKGAISLRAPVNSELSFALQQGTQYPADWRPRFATAYRQQLQAWIRSIEGGEPAGASAWDGYAASATGEAGLSALAEQRPVKVTLETRPKLYG
jgi:myo-inositol 2-dehydrogenase/D-chiro-inositol 1-dehydrogenase